MDEAKQGCNYGKGFNDDGMIFTMPYMGYLQCLPGEVIP